MFLRGERGGPREARPRGFALVELLIAVGLLLLGIALASGLLMRSQLTAAKLGAEMRNPQPRYALLRLRRDLEGGRFAPMPSSWQHGRLSLLGPDGEVVAWEPVGTVLRRTQLDASGEEVVSQALLHDVSGWRWRRSAERMIDVEVHFAIHDASAAVLTGVSRSWVPIARERRRLLRVALRSGAGAQP